jgi:hypothetical protein
MPVPPYSDHRFFEEDWGSNEAAYAAAKALFESKRAAKGEPLVTAYRADGVASSASVLLTSFSMPAKGSGGQRANGWEVREPAPTALSSRVRPK